MTCMTKHVAGPLPGSTLLERTKFSQDTPAFHLATIQRPSECIGSDWANCEFFIGVSPQSTARLLPPLQFRQFRNPHTYNDP